MFSIVRQDLLCIHLYITKAWQLDNGAQKNSCMDIFKVKNIIVCIILKIWLYSQIIQIS